MVEEDNFSRRSKNGTVTGWRVGGSLAFRSFRVSHARRRRLFSGFEHQTSNPTQEMLVGLLLRGRRQRRRVDSTCSVQQRQRLAFISGRLAQRSTDRAERGSAQPIISAFPFLPTPNLAHGCCRRSKINQPRVIHRCLLFLPHFHLLFISRLRVMPRHYLLC